MQANERPFATHTDINAPAVGPKFYKAQKMLEKHDFNVVVFKKAGHDVWYVPSSEHVLDRFEAIESNRTLPNDEKRSIIRKLIKTKGACPAQ